MTRPCTECDLPEAVDAEPITTATGERWYCHGEVSPTCYEIAQRAFGTPGTPSPQGETQCALKN